MSVTGISSSSFFSPQSTNVQNQQQWQQEFQKVSQELEASSLASPAATAQTTAATPITAPPAGSPSSIASAAQNDPSAQLLNSPHGTPKQSVHRHHPHRLQVDSGSDSDQDSTATPQPGSASSAQQAYASWQQDLQNVALNSDLLTAQNADWQPVSLSA